MASPEQPSQQQHSGHPSRIFAARPAMSLDLFFSAQHTSLRRSMGGLFAEGITLPTRNPEITVSTALIRGSIVRVNAPRFKQPLNSA
jgi:hypothetical protein